MPASVIALGDLLMTCPTDEAAEYPECMLRALDTAPDAWLTLHPIERRRLGETSFECAAFIAPTLAHIAELKDVPQDRIPAIYTLRDCAPLLVQHGLGAILYSPEADSPRSLALTLGDLVHLTLEGTLRVPRSAAEWSPLLQAPGQDNPISDFFASPEGPDEVAPFQTASVPLQVIPAALQKVLDAFLQTEMPMLERPVLARSNGNGKLALVFFCADADAAAKAREQGDRLSWFFPRHYHLLVVPRP